jgi:hypothetical protein
VTIRRLLLGFAVVVALAAAAHGAFWWIVADQLRDGFAAWAGERRGEGWTIRHGPVSVGGYPLQAWADIEGPDFADPGNGMAWRWQGERLRLRLDLLSLEEILFSFPGRQRLDVRHAKRREIFDAHLGTADGRARPGPDGRTRSVVLDLADIEARRKGTPEVLRLGRLGVTVFVPDPASDAVAAEDREPAGPVVSASAANILLPEQARYPLGRTIGKAAIDAKLIGDLAAGPTPSRTLAAWRDAGGTLEVRRIDVVWGKFDLSGEGTAALDEALQPMVAMTARIGGYGETVDALVETGQMRSRDAFATKMVLGLIARATPGGASRITLPLSLQRGVLSAGPARLLQVPAIDWDTGTVVKPEKSVPN